MISATAPAALVEPAAPACAACAAAAAATAVAAAAAAAARKKYTGKRLTLSVGIKKNVTELHRKPKVLIGSRITFSMSSVKISAPFGVRNSTISRNCQNAKLQRE